MMPRLELLLEARALLDDPIIVGPTPQGTRRMIAIKGGEFSGPRLRGVILPGGADWQYQRADGVTVLEALYLLRTDDGVTIQVTNRGLRHGPDDVMRRLAAGEIVDPASYYFRASPVLSAPTGKYDALNRSLYLCTGRREPNAVTLWMYQVL
jgi:Protein of unknown function (DUF3237)